MLTAWTTEECNRCFGMGIELGPDREEVLLCRDCRGYGEIIRRALCQIQSKDQSVPTCSEPAGWRKGANE